MTSYPHPAQQRVHRAPPPEPTCVHRAVPAAVPAAQPCRRTQSAPAARRQVPRSLSRQGQYGHRPALGRRPGPRGAPQLTWAWQLAPVHYFKLFSRLRRRPWPPLWLRPRRAAVFPVGHLGRVTCPAGWRPWAYQRGAGGRSHSLVALLFLFPRFFSLLTARFTFLSV